MKRKSKVLSFIMTFILILGLASMPAQARSKSSSTRVRSYTRKNGTYVKSYRRTTRDNTHKNNYSYKGNYNPHTGKYGTKTYKPKHKYVTKAPKHRYVRKTYRHK